MTKFQQKTRLKKCKKAQQVRRKRWTIEDVLLKYDLISKAEHQKFQQLFNKAYPQRDRMTDIEMQNADTNWLLIRCRQNAANIVEAQKSPRQLTPLQSSLVDAAMLTGGYSNYVKELPRAVGVCKR